MKKLRKAQWTNQINAVKRLLAVFIALPLVWALFHIWSLLSIAGWR